MKKMFDLYLLNEKNGINSVQRDKVPEICGIFTNNYWVEWVGQSYFAS